MPLGMMADRVLHLVSQHEGWCTHRPVKLVFDLSEKMTGGEKHCRRYLYACSEDHTSAMNRTCRHLHDGAKMLPVDGIFYHDHRQMLKELKRIKAIVTTLVLVLPEDHGDPLYYKCRLDRNVARVKGDYAELKKGGMSQALAEVMRFASNTAERVVLVNMGKSLVLSRWTRGKTRLKVITSAWAGVKFRMCTELLVTRIISVDEYWHDTLNDQLPGEESWDDSERGLPLWGISRKKFPALKWMYVMASEIEIPCTASVRLVENLRLAGSGGEDRSNPDQMATDVDGGGPRELLPGVDYRVFYGPACVATTSRDHHIYWDHRPEVYTALGLSADGTLSIPQSEGLPSEVLRTYTFLMDVRSKLPQVAPPVADYIDEVIFGWDPRRA